MTRHTGKTIRVWLAGVLGMALALAGCSKQPEVGQASDQDATKAGEKSGGVLGRIFETSKPVTVPEGTSISVTLDHAVASNQAKSGDEFEATLASPIVVEGKTVIPKGARVSGRVVEARESGRLKGVARLRLELASVEVSGKPYDIQTSVIARTGGAHKKRNIALIGGGAAVGTGIGAAAGGGKGALIGGAVGAGAGTATAAATGKKEITLEAETPLTFKLTQPVTIQVKG